jgi:hypothetical protein
VSDSEIVELDDPEPIAAPASRRIGNLAIVVAPLLAILAIAIMLSDSRPVADPIRTPEPTRRPGLVLITAFPAPTNPPTPTPSPVVLADPEVLADRTWSAIGPAYPARGDVAEAVLRGSLYVIGGTGSTEDGTLVFRYDPKTGARQRAPSLPVSLDHAMAVTLGDRIYAMGGYVFGQPSARVFSLAANDASWTEESLMPQGRAAGGAVVISERIWVVGGVSLNGSWILEPWSWDGRGRWSTGFAPIPTPRDHLAVGTYRGRVCAAGGNGGERAFECYEPVRNEWIKGPDLRKAIVAGRAVELGDWFWVISVDVHVLIVDHWQFGPRLLTPRAGEALAAVDGALYVVEGATGRAAALEVLKPQP